MQQSDFLLTFRRSLNLNFAMMAYRFLSTSGYLDRIYTEPRSVSSLSTPLLLPGRTAESARVLAHLLKKNLESHHIFLNDLGFHKWAALMLLHYLSDNISSHLSHHLYALYALGASPDALRAAYTSQAKAQRPAFESPKAITKENWKEHLGNDKYVQWSLGINVDSC